MKTIIALFAVIAMTLAGPLNISDNNIGDISSISIKVNAVVSSNIEASVATVLAAAQNQQAVIANGELPMGVAPANSEEPSSDIQITPQLLNEMKNIKVTPDMVNAIKNAFSSQ